MQENILLEPGIYFYDSNQNNHTITWAIKLSKRNYLSPLLMTTLEYLILEYFSKSAIKDYIVSFEQMDTQNGFLLNTHSINHIENLLQYIDNAFTFIIKYKSKIPNTDIYLKEVRDFANEYLKVLSKPDKFI